MTSSDLRILREQYYNLINSLNSSIISLKKVPTELEDADSQLKQTFTMNDERVDDGKLLILVNRIEQNVTKLRNHINRLETQIMNLNDQIVAKELEEEKGIL